MQQWGQNNNNNNRKNRSAGKKEKHRVVGGKLVHCAVWGIHN